MQAACSIFLAHLGKREMRLMRLSRPRFADTGGRYRNRVHPVKPATTSCAGLFFSAVGERILHLGAYRSETGTETDSMLTRPDSAVGVQKTAVPRSPGGLGVDLGVEKKSHQKNRSIFKA